VDELGASGGIGVAAVVYVVLLIVLLPVVLVGALVYVVTGTLVARR
jgi:hypothetical protein